MFTRTIHALLITTLIALTSVIQPLRLIQGQSISAIPTSNEGTVIAFVKSSRNNQSIHIVNPDGSNDREIWRVPSPVLSANGVGYVAWNPDASEIAFDSGHITASLTIRDIYAVKPNGTGLRRITNAPHPSTFNSFPKGKVAVSVYNVGASGKILQAYIEGASAPIQWEAAGGSRRDLLFEDVADYGDGVKQYVVVKDEGNRCSYDLVANADVKAGQTTRTVGDVNVYDDTVPKCLQPYRSAWTADGTQLGYLVYKQNTASPQNNFWLSPALNVPSGNKGNEVIAAPPLNGYIINFFALGPTTSRANEILFDRQNITLGGVPQIFKAPINDPALAEQVILNLKEPCPRAPPESDCRILGLAWLPDGSGFVFSLIAKDLISSNNDVNFLYRYDFAAQATTRIAALGNGVVTDVTISPDMQKVAYARALNGDAAFDIWVIDMNGANNQKIVSDARSPAWSPKPPTSSQPGATPTPAPTVAGPTATVNPNLSVRVYLPLVLQASQPTPPQPTATTPPGQPSATPSPATNLINGNFELGRNVGWAESSSIFTDVVAVRSGFIVPHSGQYVADLSDKTRALNEASAISQTVTLPPGASVLNFFYRWDSEDTTCSGDKAELIIGDGTARETLWTLILCSNNYESNNWMAKSVDVSRFAGKTVSILFRSQTNAQGGSTLAIDDVSLSTSGAATPTPTTPSNATATPTRPAITPTPTTPASSAGISGRVTYQGNPVSGIAIQLGRYDPLNNRRDLVATTKTNSNGQYLFPNVATLASPDNYVVGYLNGINGGNTDNANYLLYWRSFFITSYNMGSAADGGSFDIADVKLTSPLDNASKAAPTTFSWASRGVVGDSYSWAVATLPAESSYEKCHSAALSVTSYELNQRTYGECLLEIATAFGWYVYVGKADGSAYGQSHDYRTITFLPPTANQSDAPVNAIAPEHPANPFTPLFGSGLSAHP